MNDQAAFYEHIMSWINKPTPPAPPVYTKPSLSESIFKIIITIIIIGGVIYFINNYLEPSRSTITECNKTKSSQELINQCSKVDLTKVTKCPIECTPIGSGNNKKCKFITCKSRDKNTCKFPCKKTKDGKCDYNDKFCDSIKPSSCNDKTIKPYCITNISEKVISYEQRYIWYGILLIIILYLTKPSISLNNKGIPNLSFSGNMGKIFCSFGLQLYLVWLWSLTLY